MIGGSPSCHRAADRAGRVAAATGQAPVVVCRRAVAPVYACRPCSTRSSGPRTSSWCCAARRSRASRSPNGSRPQMSPSCTNPPVSSRTRSAACDVACIVYGPTVSLVGHARQAVRIPRPRSATAGDQPRPGRPVRRRPWTRVGRRPGRRRRHVATARAQPCRGATGARCRYGRTPSAHLAAAAHRRSTPSSRPYRPDEREDRHRRRGAASVHQGRCRVPGPGGASAWRNCSCTPASTTTSRCRMRSSPSSGYPSRPTSWTSDRVDTDSRRRHLGAGRGRAPRGVPRRGAALRRYQLDSRRSPRRRQAEHPRRPRRGRLRSFNRRMPEEVNRS